MPFCISFLLLCNNYHKVCILIQNYYLIVLWVRSPGTSPGTCSGSHKAKMKGPTKAEVSSEALPSSLTIGRIQFLLLGPPTNPTMWLSSQHGSLLLKGQQEAFAATSCLFYFWCLNPAYKAHDLEATTPFPPHFSLPFFSKRVILCLSSLWSFHVQVFLFGRFFLLIVLPQLPRWSV